MIYIKTKDEISRIRESGIIVADFLKRARSLIRPGITTKDLDELAWDVVKEYKAKPSFYGYKGYPSAVCVSINEEVIHSIPSNRVIKEGDIVSVDFGALLNGFHADAAFSVIVGGGNNEDSSVKQKLIEVGQNALKKAIEVLKPGAYLCDLSYEIQTLAESYGFSVVKEYSGHGIGRELHEDPPVPNFGKRKTGPILREGMVICIEPMICLGGGEVSLLSDGWTVVTKDGKLSSHFEHTIAITDAGPEILTL